ncbi:MAG: hypothetical protein ACFB16_02355 [Phormidesmis sp.]
MDSNDLLTEMKELCSKHGKTAMSTFIAFGAVLSIYKVIPDEYQLQDNEDSYVNVPIEIRNSNEEPVSGVKVQFTSEGAPEPKVTDTDGFVEISIPERNDIRVVFRHEEYKTVNRTLDLRKDPEKTKVYYMDRATTYE